MTDTPNEPVKAGDLYSIEHDGFVGKVLATPDGAPCMYVTDEGKVGVVMQQIGTRVVHVYGTRWLSPLPAPPQEGR